MRQKHPSSRANNQMPALFEPGRLYSIKEIGDVIGGRTHRITLYAWARRGKFGPTYRIGENSIRYLGANLNDALTPTD